MGKYKKFNDVTIPNFEMSKSGHLDLLRTLQIGLCSGDEKYCSGISCDQCMLDRRNIKEFGIWFEMEGKELFNSKGGDE